MSPTLVSKRFDWGWFVLPGVLAVVAAVALGQTSAPRHDTGLALWIGGVLLVDVAHVYASLYRTYLDPIAWQHHRRAMMVTPVVCLWVGFVLHQISPLLFWSVLAYLAIFHFIKQHVGFALLYIRKGGESPLDRKLVELTIWAGTAGPVIWWHANLPRAFAWFTDGDLITGVPTWAGDVAMVGCGAALVVFAARRVQLRARGHKNPLLEALVLVPVLNWVLGIVVYNDDRIFTLTNVFLHGVPYLALVWVAGGRARVEKTVGARAVVVVAAAFYGALLMLAFAEELAWDKLVWHEREELFGAGVVVADEVVTALVVAVLTVPQATHYVLDRYIWRAGPKNPELAKQLGF